MGDDLAVHCIVPRFYRQTVQSLFFSYFDIDLALRNISQVFPHQPGEQESYSLASFPSCGVSGANWLELTQAHIHPSTKKPLQDVPKFDRTKAGRPPTRTHMPTQRSMATPAANGSLPLSLDRGLPYLRGSDVTMPLARSAPVVPLFNPFPPDLIHPGGVYSVP